MTPASLRTYIGTWIALMVLLALTLGSSFVPLHGFNTTVNVAIALVKATLVAVVFMRLRTSSALVRLAALAGVMWLLILIGLSFTDLLIRY
jgi:caa(3)-type oxidase, subunit IV